MGGNEHKELLQELKKEFEAFRQDYHREKHIDNSTENKVYSICSLLKIQIFKIYFN
jgi:ribulose bisphosphate carboxylase small subunit